jgi:hypothetical protein
MRLIDADELINVILKDRKLDGINANWEINRILVHIKKAPTIEQELYITGAQWDEFMKEHKRPHGEWISNANGYMGINFGRKCSLCGKTVEFSENFCPNCGAYMRGNNNE